jgi:hypothetical protein
MRCKTHPTYTAQRPPRSLLGMTCHACWYLFTRKHYQVRYGFVVPKEPA